MNKRALKAFVKKIYDKINSMIDNEECDYNECSKEDIEFYQTLFYPKVYIVEDAAKFLEISNYKFKLLRKSTVIPNPVKIVGLKQKLWTKKQLIKVKKELESMDNF